MAYFGQRTFSSYQKEDEGWGKLFEEDQELYTNVKDWFKNELDVVIPEEERESFDSEISNSTEDKTASELHTGGEAELLMDENQSGEKEELEKALNKIKEYLNSSNGVLHSFEELPLESSHIYIRVKVYSNRQTFGYFDVRLNSEKNKYFTRISEEEYGFDRPDNQDKLITTTNKKGVNVELYVTNVMILPTINFVFKKPETLAKELFSAYDGIGTDEEKAFEVLRVVAPYKSERYNEVNKAYLQLYGAKRNGRNIVEDTIYEMLDSPAELREAFNVLEYDVSEMVLKWMKAKRYDVDNLAYAVRDQDMEQFSVEERYNLIEYIATGVVENEDEETIIRLFSNTPVSEIKPLLKNLTTDNGKLLKRLESKINFSEYSQYHQTLHMLYQLQFFYENTPKDVAEQMENSKHLFAYRNPSAISGAFKVRNYIDQVKIVSGKVEFRYWNLGPGFGVHNNYSFGLFEPVTILFMDDEPTFNAKAGERVMMPAINLFALEDAQTMREGKLAVDLALILSGAGGIFSAASKAGKVWAGVEVLMGAADITINELRPEIAESDSGREFLKYWDIASTLITVYGIGRVAMQMPQIFRKLGDSYRSYKNVSKLGKNKLGKVDELMDELRLSVQKAKDEARTKVKNPNNTTHIAAREDAWTKYKSKNPDADFDKYKTKYDTLAINREAGVLTEKEFQLLMGGEKKTLTTS